MVKHGRIPRVKIHDIAREANVSISTVSRVLNQTVPVAQETSERVWAAIERLDYTPNSAAKRLASKRANTIGLLLPEISGLFFAPMLRGIEHCVNRHGFDLLIYSSGNREKSFTTRRFTLGEHNTDGLLVFTGSLEDHDLAWLHRRGFPVVLLHRSSPAGVDIPSVMFENSISTESLIDHLVETHGCRRIALFRGPEGNEDSTQREAGFRASLERHGISVDPDLIERGHFDTQGGMEAMQRLLESGAPFDAVFAGDDEAAAGALFALNQRGIRVPEDKAVVGFDDNMIAPFLPAPLTTVHASSEEAGAEAAGQLIRFIQTGKAEPQVILPTGVVIRRSCGCMGETV